MDSRTRVLYWLLNASRGGPTRIRILNVLSSKPMNTRKLAMELGLDYKTIQGHIELLVENGIIYTPKTGYGQVFFISPEWEENEFFMELMNGEENGKKARKARKKARKK